MTVIRRDETSRSALLALGLEPRVSVVHGDITGDGVVARAVSEYEIDTVFHLAAQTLVPTANRSPVSTFETNMRGTWLTLEACRLTLRPARGRGLLRQGLWAAQRAAVHRDHALQPRFPYDVSKAATDLIARSYWHTWRLPVAITRFANLYGGGDFNDSRLVPEAVVAALTGRSPVVRSDGSPERDFLYVEDAVAAYLAIAGSLATAREVAAGEAFNAGGGQPHRVLDVVELICGLAGTGVQPDVRGKGPRLERSTVSGSTIPSSAR